MDKNSSVKSDLEVIYLIIITVFLVLCIGLMIFTFQNPSNSLDFSKKVLSVSGPLVSAVSFFASIFTTFLIAYLSVKGYSNFKELINQSKIQGYVNELIANESVVKEITNNLIKNNESMMLFNKVIRDGKEQELSDLRRDYDILKQEVESLKQLIVVGGQTKEALGNDGLGEDPFGED